MIHDLTPYWAHVRRWFPGADVREEPAPRGPDALVRCGHGAAAVTFVVEHKRHLATQDIGLAIAQVERWVAALERRKARGLILAPYIRLEQAAALKAHGVDYLDLAGNVHLEAPGVFVHVEGKRPAKEFHVATRRTTKGWARTVMALLLEPTLTAAPYRAIAEANGVALGTVMATLKDLEWRGLLKTVHGERRLTNWPELLALWVQAYGDVLRPKLVVRQFQMRETDKHARWEQLHRELGTRGIPWFLTGADGATVHNNYLVAPETEVYAAPARFDDRELLKALQAQPARRGNLHVIEPPGPPRLMLGTRAQPKPFPTAPPLLIYAELRFQRADQANEAAELMLPELINAAP